MVDSIASASMSASAASLQLDYALAMTKKAMDTQETLAQGVINMLPAPSDAKYIDVYA